MDLEVQGTMTEAYVDELVERMRFYGLFPVRIGRTILIAPNEDISYVAKSNGESLIALAARTPLPENIRQKISRLERPWDIDSDCDVVRALAIEPAERAP